jgi:transcriptional regulator with XRE-family HTH domain
MNKKSDITEVDAPEIPDPASDAEALQRTMRLREAVRLAGGNAVVAKASGVPLSTLSAYMDGRDLKISRAAAIAKACGVSLDWLATGRTPPHDRPPSLTDVTRLPLMGTAMELTVRAYRLAGYVENWESFALFALMFYDRLAAPGADIEAIIAQTRMSVEKE